MKSIAFRLYFQQCKLWSAFQPNGIVWCWYSSSKCQSLFKIYGMIDLLDVIVIYSFEAQPFSIENK